MKMFNPSHPGKLLAYYLEGRTVTEVARHLRVTRPALSKVPNGKASVSAAMAWRSADAVHPNPARRLRLPAPRDLWAVTRKRRAKVKPLVQSAAA